MNKDSNKEEIVQYFLDHPSYIRESKAKKVSDVYNIPLDLAKEAYWEAKRISGISRKKTAGEYIGGYLDKHNLELSDVKNIKIYGNPDKPLLSIATKNEWYGKGENVKEIIDSILLQFKDEIKPITLIQKTAVSKALFIYTADKHIGAKTKENSLYENEYNAEIFTKRLLECVRIAKEMYDLHGRFDKIYIVDLGDALDGYNQQSTRRSVILPQNLSNQEQIDTYFSAHKQLFDNLVSLNITNNIEWICCANDNHGGDWAYAAHRILDVYLECKYPDIKRKIITKFLDHITYGSHTFIFTHGKDKEEMKHGLPLVLNSNAEIFINNYIHYYKIHTPGIHVIKGDLHQSAEQRSKTFRYKNCMSLYGASNWIMTNFGMNYGGINFEVVEKNANRISKDELIFE